MSDSVAIPGFIFEVGQSLRAFLNSPGNWLSAGTIHFYCRTIFYVKNCKPKKSVRFHFRLIFDILIITAFSFLNIKQTFFVLQRPTTQQIKARFQADLLNFADQIYHVYFQR